MDKFQLYKDIQARTNGEIYIGVVGPVRTGKSTFIKKLTFLFLQGLLSRYIYPRLYALKYRCKYYCLP